MTRFKRELMKRGYMLEETLECMPYNGIEAIFVHPEAATLSYYHISAGLTTIHFNRAMQEEAVDYDLD